MDEVTQQNAALVEEAAAAAEAMREQAQGLAKTVSVFKLTERRRDSHSFETDAAELTPQARTAYKPSHIMPPEQARKSARRVGVASADSQADWEEF
jgi:methyl-accepting chemotaxis protein